MVDAAPFSHYEGSTVAYVRKSKSRGKEYRQIVESYREDGKVKQRVLAHMPRFADTPEHAVDLCEGYAETERGLEEKYTKKAEDAHVRRERYNQSRIARGSCAPLHPAPHEVKYLQEAERYARQAQKYESKAKTIRDLIASGKIQPDTPEVREEREQREQRKQERVARQR